MLAVTTGRGPDRSLGERPLRSLTFRLSRRAALLVAALLLAAGCGGSGDGGGQGGDGPVQEGFSVFVASYDLAVGPPSRFLVGLLDASNQPVSYGQVTMRFAYLGEQAKASVDAEPTITAPGSFLAIPGSKVDPAAKTPRPTPPSVAKGVYAGEVGFDKAGYWGVEVRAELEGTGLRNGTSVFEVRKDHTVPAVGQPAPRTRNLIATSKGVPKAAIDSRAQGGGPIPDAVLHKTTIANSIARKRPAVVVFSTPVYCQSQFCGPITDMVEGLAGRYGAEVDLIHVEIWKDFTKQQLNDAAKQWLYAGGNGNEPWVFVIGGDGKIKARFDNVATEGELTAVLDEVTG